MKPIHTITEANEILAQFVPVAKRVTGKQMTLQRMLPLLATVGNPHERLKIVHVAGTSGKTSTAYYIAALLQAAGNKVGLTVSPHIDSVAERVQLDGQPLADDVFCRELEMFLGLIDADTLQPSYFELLVTFAYWIFDKYGVDYAVVETGLGGLHDGTNVAQRADKLCVITDIGYDHMHILGSRISDIASQKAGIIHEGNHVFLYNQSSEVMDAIQARVRQYQANMHLVHAQSAHGTMPLYQQRNWFLAHEAYQYLAGRDSLSQLTDAQLHMTQQLQVPARMDTIHQKNKTIIMDGAHNQQKMAAFVSSFQAVYPGQKAALLVAFKEDKEYQQAIDELVKISDNIIITTFSGAQDLPSHAIDPEAIMAYCRTKNVKKLQVAVEHIEGYKLLLEQPEPLLVVTGSFYLIAQLRAQLR